MGKVWVVAALAVLAVLVRYTLNVRSELARGPTVVGAAYTGSEVCRKCHIDHDRSFRRTYHRTMTREAGPGTVLGDFSGQTLSYMGVTATMDQTADGHYRMTVSDGERQYESEIVRTVGSHRFQQYLARKDDLFVRLPVAWDVAEGRFIHLNGAFLTPDPPRAGAAPVSNGDYHRHVTRWNDNCIFCHNVGANPGADGEGRFDSEVAELGVACEACHGPGGRHVRANQDPVRRYLMHAGVAEDPDIASPKKMSSLMASQVCGRCHGQRMSRDIAAVHRDGDRYVPGESLDDYSQPLFRETTLDGEEGAFAERFWSDGTPRLTAYEFQGYLQSACRAADDFSCGSCHSMHRGDPSGQIRPDKLDANSSALFDNGLCTQCHDGYKSVQQAAAHSGHQPNSLGTRCVACHMPNIVYGLVGAHPSHRITIPAAATTGQAGASAPDACRLCHVSWSRGQRTARREGPLVHGVADLDSDQNTMGARVAALPMLKLVFAGDPVQRSIAASALGRVMPSDSEDVHKRRLGALLNVVEFDSYPAVREIARKSAVVLAIEVESSIGGELRMLRGTDEVASRVRAVSIVRSALYDLNEIVEPDVSEVQALRQMASSRAIFIGE